MKLIDNILYLEFSELAECGVSENYLSKAKSTGAKCWKFIPDPADKRKVLIDYEELNDTRKEQVQKRYGNPYEYLAKAPIRAMVVKDGKAEEFYLAHRYGDNKMLPIDHVRKYTTAASWLNMLVKASADKKAIKKTVNLTIEQFYLHVLELIKTDKVDLPTNYQALLRRRREYEEKGYSCLIDWRFGNQNAAKVADEVAESTLLRLVEQPNQYDDVLVSIAYNTWAVANGHEPITSATVGNWRRKNDHLIKASREGRAAWNDKYGREVKGHRPTTPLYMVESDDNHLDLLFVDPDDKSPHRAYHRYKAIVVTDSYNDYVLGYAYAENLTPEVVRAAYISAMHHIRELTGSWYLPHEVKTDRWRLSDLRPFYQGIGNYFDSVVGNKQRGYLEQFFSSMLWKRSMKIGAKNYTGNNMTAVNRGVNLEELDLNKKERLTLEEGRNQVDAFFHRLRHTVNEKTGKSKQQEWIEAWAATAEEDKRACTDEQYLLKFGIVHRPRNRKPIAITKGGVEPQIAGVQYNFVVPPALLLQNIGKPVNIVYDPCDMSRVLVTDFASLRFTATAERFQPRALADSRPGDRHLLNAILAEKLDNAEKVAQAAEKRQRILRANNIDPETLLQAGVMDKELKQAAEAGYQPALIDRSNYNPLDRM